MDNTNVDKTGTILFSFKMFSPIFAAKKHNNRLLKELIPNPLTKYIVTFLVCHILCYLLGAGTKHPIPFMYITANILYTYVVWCNLTCSKDLAFFQNA